MKKLSIILSLALMPVFAACGNANSKTSETSAAGNENVIRKRHQDDIRQNHRDI